MMKQEKEIFKDNFIKTISSDYDTDLRYDFQDYLVMVKTSLDDLFYIKFRKEESQHAFPYNETLSKDLNDIFSSALAYLEGDLYNIISLFYLEREQD